MATSKAMTIGELAAAAGVNVETVRYYQRRGLLGTPARLLGAQRRYSDVALERLIFIRNAQKLAFSLGEVERLLAMPDARGCKAVREIAQQKLADLGERIGEINRARRRLRMLVTRCERSLRARDRATILSLLAAVSRDAA